MPERRSLSISALVVLSLAGCGSSRLSSFPEFPTHKARLGKSVIVADFLVMRASGGDTASVDLAANKASADTILRFVQAHLDAKGYGVGNRLLSSVGLLLDSSFTANVFHTSELDLEGVDDALSIHPPFYLYQALRRDPGLTSLIGALYRKLVMLEESDAGYPPMPEMVPLGKVFGGGMVFLLLGGGFEVAAGSGGDGVTAGRADAQAKIGYQTITQASLHLFVLDSETGDVLWTDHRVSRGGMVYDDKFIRMAGLMLQDLP